MDNDNTIREADSNKNKLDLPMLDDITPKLELKTDSMPDLSVLEPSNNGTTEPAENVNTEPEINLKSTEPQIKSTPETTETPVELKSNESVPEQNDADVTEVVENVEKQTQLEVDNTDALKEGNENPEVPQSNVEEVNEKVETVEVMVPVDDDANNRTEDDIEFQVILNDNPSNVLSINGIPQLMNENTTAYNNEPEQAEDEAQEEVHSVKADEEYNEEILDSEALASDAEMTYDVVESQSNIVTFANDMSDQDTQEVVILSEEQMLLMESEDYDQPETIEVNVLKDDEDDEEERLSPVLQGKQKSKRLQIPRHILGRNVKKPLEDVRDRRIRMKPRLGVKIPCMNLTSQIVSKQDITNAIMERSRLRQSNVEPPAGGDVFFVKKLTQRLAEKLTPGSKQSSSKSAPSTSSSSSSRVEAAAPTAKAASQPATDNPKGNKTNVPDKITDNSDLIALLEGDDDPEWNTSPSPQKRDADWEREMALKQLRELPKRVTRTGGGPRVKITNVTKKPPPQSFKVETPKSLAESAPSGNVEGGGGDAEFKEDLIAEPQFSSSSVTKTYTRKRKPFEGLLKSTGVQMVKKAIIAVSGSKTDQPPPVLSPQKDMTNIDKKSPESPRKITLKTSTSSTPTHKSPGTQKSPSTPTSPPKLPKSSIPALKPIQKSPADKKRSSSPQSPQPEIKKLASPNTYISKSSRIIKKKKIWDPDEATPTFKVTAIKSSPKITEIVSSPPSEKKSPSKPVEKTAREVIESPKAVLKPSNEKSPPPKKLIVKKEIVKRKKFKRLTEVDKLLMDEGAVNLLYSVKNTEEVQNTNKKKKKKSMISLHRAQRELLNKTNEIKNDLQISSTRDTPISLRKKDGISLKGSPVANRKKSKDSISESAQSRSESPAYEFTQHAEASRIIRRRSSSSFSSDNEEIEEELEEEEEEEEENSTPTTVDQPQLPKKQLNHDKHLSMEIDKQLLKEEMSKNFNRLLTSDDESKYSNYETLNVKIFDQLVQIVLIPTSSSGQIILTHQVLWELTEILNALQKDASCKVVAITSSGNAFCQGIDYTELVAKNKEQRKLVAEKYALRVREFLMALVRFPKPLVAGVHGHIVGLGVTMLPLFDMVLASDTAMFSTPYAHLGCLAEGGVLLTHPCFAMHRALISDLLFACRQLTATEVVHFGLVTRTVYPDKFHEDVMSILKVISNQSSQGMQGIKKQLRHHLHSSVEAALKSESTKLVQHWMSDECQYNFENYTLESEVKTVQII